MVIPPTVDQAGKCHEPEVLDPFLLPLLWDLQRFGPCPPPEYEPCGPSLPVAEMGELQGRIGTVSC
jgi:hypothetical protein